MKVLIACEFSGIVRDAFIKKGHEALSCDLLPTESEGPHYQGDIFDIIDDGWDLMIAHPPCTYLTNAANRWLTEDCAATTAEERIELREEAIEFFIALQQAPIEKIAIENPQPHPYVLTRVGKKYDKIQPHNFDEPYQKGIYLWLKNLPPLISTVIETRREQKCFNMSPGKNRSKERSRFFPGIADAMANQWG